MKIKLLSFILISSCISPAIARQSAAQKPQHDQPITRPVNTAIGEGGNTHNFDMAPETTRQIVEAAVSSITTKMPAGPFKPEWGSLEANYRVPEWFATAKFGLCMHWGVYTVPAHHNEWYEKHMYGNPSDMRWHNETFGPQEKFGYKDFIPMFTMEKFDADAWASLFKKSGAKFIMPAAQHHDNFALWDSKVTKYNSVQMGPKRDLIGELGVAVRKQGMKFGFTNHGIENFQFINPPAELLARMKEQQTDLFDPQWKDFYNVADRSDEACRKFLLDWYNRNVELIDKYRPDVLWFDNGIDQRYLDPIKLQVAAYYYNSAKQWGKDVTLNTKKAAFAPTGTNIATIGSILDFENKIPPGIRTGVWDVDSQIGTTWGYTDGMRVASAASIIDRLADVVSKNGTLLLNLSPKADGTLPEEQQQTLLGVGKWLNINGEAIYETHNWIKFGEDGQQKVRFTVREKSLYAILLGPWPGSSVSLTSLGLNAGLKGNISSVTMLGSAGKLNFAQNKEALSVTLPPLPPGDHAYVLKINGLQMNEPTITRSGNPIPGYGEH